MANRVRFSLESCIPWLPRHKIQRLDRSREEFLFVLRGGFVGFLPVSSWSPFGSVIWFTFWAPKGFLINLGVFFWFPVVFMLLSVRFPFGTIMWFIRCFPFVFLPLTQRFLRILGGCLGVLLASVLISLKDHQKGPSHFMIEPSSNKMMRTK